MAFIGVERSVMLAADVPSVEEVRRLTRAVKGVPGLFSVKLGLLLGFEGLKRSVDAIRGESPLVKIVFDLQKAGNDIPDMGVPFARQLKKTGCDAAILFPFAGPATQEAWTEACKDAGLQVLIGSVMTHEKFLVSEGGYVADIAAFRILDLACKMGVTDYVVPGTKEKIHWVKNLRAHLERILGLGRFDLYAPGLVTQGGDITECGLAAGPRFHAIVGRGIYNQLTPEAMRAAAIASSSKLVVA